MNDKPGLARDSQELAAKVGAWAAIAVIVWIALAIIVGGTVLLARQLF